MQEQTEVAKPRNWRKPRSMGPAERAMGALILKRRFQLGLSQADVAEKLGLSFQQVQKYEKGANRIAQGRLQQFAEVLNVPISYFYGGGMKPIAPTEVQTVLCGLDTKTALRLLRAFVRMDREDARRLVIFIEALADD